MPDYSETEHPYNHILQGTMPIAFLALWSLDSFVFRISTFLSEGVGLPFRIALGIPVLVLAIFLMNRAHQIVFGDPGGERRLIDSGIYGRVRHPMYLGSLLIYVFFIITTLSIISLVAWIAVCIVIDRMASFEERYLLGELGNDYVEYTKRVPRWLPRI